jgi:uncharacterized membrane protein
MSAIHRHLEKGNASSVLPRDSTDTGDTQILAYIKSRQLSKAENHLVQSQMFNDMILPGVGRRRSHNASLPSTLAVSAIHRHLEKGNASSVLPRDSTDTGDTQILAYIEYPAHR